MSKLVRSPRRSTLADLLRDVLGRAAGTLYGDRAALYVVQLTDADGLALALRVHAQIPGPDPAVLLGRALARSIRVPLMPGAAPVETVARILETIGGDVGNARRRAHAVREAYAAGGVPVVFLDVSGAVVTTLEAIEGAGRARCDGAEPSGAENLGGWFRSCRMEA